MDLYKRYELIDPLPGPGTKSFRARQVSTAREVTVHLLVGGRTPENEQLLARLRAMPAQSFSKLIEVGDNDGTPYVVTMAPPYQHLSDWLSDQEKVAQNVPRVTHAGAWRAPASPPESKAPPAVAPATPPAARGTISPAPPAPAPPSAAATPAAPSSGQGTGKSALLLPTGAPSRAEERRVPASQPGAPATSQSGQFPRNSQGGAPPVPEPAKPPAGALTSSNAPAAPPANPASQPSAPPESGPGEFTRVFQRGGSSTQPAKPTQEPAKLPAEAQASSGAPAAPPAKLPSQPSASPESGPGEFTRVFQRGGSSTQEPVKPPTAALSSSKAPAAPPANPASQPGPPAASEPGEFTRVFQAAGRTDPEPKPPVTVPPASVSSPPAKPAAPSSATAALPAQPTSQPGTPAASEPGEFTRIFQTGARSPGQPQAASPQQAVEAPASVSSPPAKPAAPSSATGALPAQPASQPGAPAASEPGEFTRIFQTGARSPGQQQPASPQQAVEAPALFADLPARPAVPSTSPVTPPPGEFTRRFQDSPKSPIPEPAD